MGLIKVISSDEVWSSCSRWMMRDEEFPELPPSPWFLPGSLAACFLWVYQQTDQHGTNTHSTAVDASLLSAFYWLYNVSGSLIPSLARERRSGDVALISWPGTPAAQVSTDRCFRFAPGTAPGTFQHLFRNWGNLPGGRSPATMKVTVTFGDTSVVVPCKSGWTVRDLIDQATRRYRRILEQVNTEHVLMSEIADYLATEHQKPRTLLFSRSFPYFKSTITLWVVMRHVTLHRDVGTLNFARRVYKQVCMDSFLNKCTFKMQL